MQNVDSGNLNKKFRFPVLTLIGFGAAFAVVMACSDSPAKAKPNIVHKDAPRAGVVAKVAGEEISEDALIGDDKLDFIELKKREYDLKMERLNKLMVEKMIGAEAKKAGMTLDDFINKKVIGGEIKISDKQYKKFVEEKHIPESQINPQIKDRIMAYLQGSEKQDRIKAYVAKLTKANPVEVYFKKPGGLDVEIGKAPVFGGEKAKVTIVEFSDFQCPYCSRAAATVKEIKKKYGSKIRLAFKHFPLPMHPQARPTAEASMCVAEQGADKFWKFHDHAFEAQDKLDPANLEKIAKDAGADVAKFKDCVGGKKYAEFIQKDMEYGEKIGVKSTPTFFVNGQLISGARSIDEFSEVIDEELSMKD